MYLNSVRNQARQGRNRNIGKIRLSPNRSVEHAKQSASSHVQCAGVLGGKTMVRYTSFSCNDDCALNGSVTEFSVSREYLQVPPYFAATKGHQSDL